MKCNTFLSCQEKMVTKETAMSSPTIGKHDDIEILYDAVAMHMIN